MKPIFKTACAALMLAAFAAPSFAERKEPPPPPPVKHSDFEDRAHTVPEINGAGASLALALLGGIVLIVRERRKS